MSRFMRLLLSTVMAVLGWLAFPAVAASALPGTQVATYAYDAPAYDAPGAAAMSERGPPASRSRVSIYDAVAPWLYGASARMVGPSTSAITTYATAAAPAQAVVATTTTGRHVLLLDGETSPFRGFGVAANSGEKLLWTSWQNYPKVTQGGRQYAQIGDRLYTQHAVDRLQPSGLGAPAGATGAGRSVSPNFVEDVLSNSSGVPVKGPNGEARLSFVSGTVQVITEDNIVITVITR